MSETRSFKILDRACNVITEVHVISLSHLVRDVQEKFEFTDDLKIVLESDGTIVDDEEYFATLEPNTCLMVLKCNESWNAHTSRCSVEDEADFARPNLDCLLRRLEKDTSLLVTLSNKDLELLSDVDPETLGDFQNKNFLHDIQEACNLYLNDRRDAKDCIQLMKLYNEVSK